MNAVIPETDLRLYGWMGTSVAVRVTSKQIEARSYSRSARGKHGNMIMGRYETFIALLLVIV
jgi:hypothetical protein